jgi:hypothetical protein
MNLPAPRGRELNPKRLNNPGASSWVVYFYLESYA